MDDMHQAKIKSEFDGLLQAGLGSSASAAVALVGAINKYKSLGMSLEQIAERAWEIEVNKIKLYGGKQDQYASVYGGLNLFEFSKKVKRTRFNQTLARELAECMLLFYTGENRKSAVIQEGFKKLTQTQIQALDQIKMIVDEALIALYIRDYEQIGYLLNKAWEFKKKSNSGVSNPKIDNLYEQGMNLGAWGGKVCGAGGGGFMMFMVDPSKQVGFLKRMNLEHWDFSPDFNGLEVRDITDK